MPHNFRIRLKADEFKRKLNIKDGKDGSIGPIGPQGPVGIGKLGKSGKDAKPPTKTELKKLIKPLIPEPIPGENGADGSPDTPIEIRNKLELLDGNYRLDAKAIKNLPNLVVTRGNKQRPFIKTVSDTASVDLAVSTGGNLTATVLPAGVDHGGLGGLADDDHTQYALLAGRSGGQTLIGGTAATDDLILRSTSGIGATGADIIFQVGNNGGTEAMRILNSGNVGIGTTTPDLPLEVAGVVASPTPLASAIAAGALKVGDGDTVGSAIGVVLNGSSYDTYIQARNMGAASTPYNILLNPLGGVVGIGTLLPTAVLHLKAGTATASTAPFKFTSGTNLTTAESGAMEFDGTALTYTTSTPTRIRLLGASLGISGGTTLIGGTGTTDDLILRTTSGAGASGADMIFQVGNNGATEAMRILNNGSVGIGTTSSYLPDTTTKLTIATVGNNLITFEAFSTDTGLHSSFLAKKSRSNTLGTITTTIDLDIIGSFTFRGVNTSNAFVTGAFFKAEQAGTAGASWIPTALRFFTSSGTAAIVERFTIMPSGNIGFGQVAPTALLHLKAGTATASTAPLKFTSGTNLTTAEAGAMEYNGTNLFFTRTGTTREYVVVGDTIAAPSTTAGGTLTNRYGGDTNFLGDPVAWLSFVRGATTYKIPLYT